MMQDQQELEHLRELNRMFEERLKEKDATIAALQTTIKALQDNIDKLQTTIANLNETLAEFRRDLFGTSSEKSKKKSLKEPSSEEGSEQDCSIVKEHTRTRKKKSVREELYAALPVREIRCDVPEAERICPDCGAAMNHLGYKMIREELRIIPAKVERVR